MIRVQPFPAPRASYCWLGIALALFAWLLVAVPAGANPVKTENTEVQLVSEVGSVQEGQPFWVALRMRMREGWHTYWRNPGDSGLATSLTWGLPAGARAGDIQWPYPERIPTGPLLNQGYHGEVFLLTEVTPPTELSPDQPFALEVDARWLVCKEDCIPEQTLLRLSLPVTATPPARAAEWASAFAKTRQALPQPAPWSVSFTPDAESIVLHLPAATSTQIEFYPYADGVIEYAAPQLASATSDGVNLSLTRGLLPDPPGPLQGVLVLRGGAGSGDAIQAFTVEATSTVPPPPVAVAEYSLATLLNALGLAFLGGIILNFMPCVLPVLSMKALNILEHGQGGPWVARWHGLAYTAGVMICFAAIAAVLLALRVAGAQIGWGFQLQSPVFVAFLAYLMFAMGLSLSGVFTVGDRWMGVGGGLAERPGYWGSFGTGLLATVVATPCTAPFMGAALGFALAQPWMVAMAVFLALGFGMALPYLLLGFSPRLTRWLPRPGPWMARLKEVLAFPMYATAAWLVWVLTVQTGAAGVAAALAGMILIAFAAWLFQTTRLAAPRWRLASHFGAGGALLIALALPSLPALSGAPLGLPAVKSEARRGPAWETFSNERLAALRAERQPVFVNFTAAWCITCLVNERLVLSSPRLSEHFTREKIVYLKADWTNHDAAITQALAAFGRNGVPLYVYYPPGGEPILLPQILTETLVLNTLSPATRT